MIQGLLFSVAIVVIWVSGFALGYRQAVTMLSTLGVVATVIGIAKPQIGMFGIGILCTLDAVTRVFVLTGGLLRWNTFNYILLIACGLSFPLLVRCKDLPKRMLTLLLVFLGCNLLFVPQVAGGVQHMLGAVAYYGLLVYFMRGTKDQSLWEWVAIVCLIVGALGGFLYFLQQDRLPYINKNAWAFLPLTAIFSACLARTHQSQRKSVAILLWTMVIANVVWVVLSGSRGGMTIAASCLLYLLSGIPGVSGRAIILAGGVFLGGILASDFAEQREYAIQRFDKSVNSEISISSRTSGRSDLAIGGWRMFLQHPIIGVGTGGYSKAWLNLENREAMGNYAADRASQAHSAWVKTLAEGGIPGIALLIAFVFSFTRLGFRSGDRPLLYLGLLVSVTFSVAFISTEFQGKGLWFFAAGSTVVLSRELQRLREASRLKQQRRPERSAPAAAW